MNVPDRPTRTDCPCVACAFGRKLNDALAEIGHLREEVATLTRRNVELTAMVAAERDAKIATADQRDRLLSRVRRALGD